MNKFLAALIAASVVTVGLAGRGEAQQQTYNYPRIVEILVSSQVNQLDTDDRNKNDAIASYLIGFTIWVDRSCDFLPMDTFKRLESAATSMNSAGQRGDDRKRQLFEVLRAGFADAKQFVAANGCATRASKAAIASLGHVFRG